MKKLLMNRKVVNGPYGGGNNFVKAVCEYAPQYGYEVIHSFRGNKGIESNIDAILLIDPRYDELGISIREIAAYKAKFPSTKVIHRINECDKRKGTNDVDKLLVESSKVADVGCFISEWIMNYFEEWHCPKRVVYSGANKEHFHPLNEDVKYFQKKLHNALDAPINIVVHHWSNNIMKNKFTHELDEWIGKNNKRYTFTYIGRSPDGLKNTIVIPPKWGKELGELLGQYDVVVNSSLWDPCPNSLIESVSCSLPVFVYKDGGGGVEIVEKSKAGFVYDNFDHLVYMLESYTKEDYYNMSRNIGWITTWDACMKTYFEIIDA